MQKASAKKSGEPQRPAQYRFLTELAKDGRPVAIFLVNGLKLEGRVVAFDDYAILLEGDLSDHVYKHAISTIQPLTGAAAKHNGGGKSHARAAVRSPLKRVEPESVAGAEERKPRQPTIVVRAKRRVIKSTPGEG